MFKLVLNVFYFVFVHDAFSTAFMWNIQEMKKKQVIVQ